MLTYIYPHKPLRKIEVTICNHKADSPLYDVMMLDPVICKFKKSIVKHDTECPYWDQVSYNNTFNQTKPSYSDKLYSQHLSSTLPAHSLKWWCYLFYPEVLRTMTTSASTTTMLICENANFGMWPITGWQVWTWLDKSLITCPLEYCYLLCTWFYIW